MESTATGRPCVCTLWQGVMSCPVSAAWHSCVAAHWSKYNCYKQAPSWYDLRCLKVRLNPNKVTNINHWNISNIKSNVKVFHFFIFFFQFIYIKKIELHKNSDPNYKTRYRKKIKQRSLQVMVCTLNLKCLKQKYVFFIYLFLLWNV